MTPEPWRVVATEPALDERWFRVRRETVELPDGAVVDDYFVAVREDFALVAAVTETDELVLVRQWKQGIRQLTLELPGGIVEAEDPAAAAARELLEETGYACDELLPLGAGPLDPRRRRTASTSSPAQERAASPGRSSTRPSRSRSCSRRSGDLRDRIRAGEIDAPTSVAGIYLALERLGRL